MNYSLRGKFPPEFVVTSAVLVGDVVWGEEVFGGGCRVVVVVTWGPVELVVIA